MRTGRRVKNRIKDNRGISLVELIVVIAILGVMVGVTSLSVAFMYTRDANYVAVRIDDALTEARMLSMSREGEFSYVLHIDSDSDKSTVTINNKVAGVESEYKKILLDKRVTIAVTGAGIAAGAGDDVTIVFSKTNGSVKTINGAAASGAYTIKVTSERNTSKYRDVTLISATGRHYTEN